MHQRSRKYLAAIYAVTATSLIAGCSNLHSGTGNTATSDENCTSPYRDTSRDSSTSEMPMMPQPTGSPSAQEQSNMKAVVAFYEAGLNRKDFDAARAYLGADYLQHNPNAADGVDGFRAFIAHMRATTPDSHSEIKRVFADGDYVILHVHKILKPGDRGVAIVDIFRLSNGKIVEHWDVSQDVPERTVSGNPMF